MTATVEGSPDGIRIPVSGILSSNTIAEHIEILKQPKCMGRGDPENDGNNKIISLKELDEVIM